MVTRHPWLESCDVNLKFDGYLVVIRPIDRPKIKIKIWRFPSGNNNCNFENESFISLDQKTFDNSWELFPGMDSRNRDSGTFLLEPFPQVWLWSTQNFELGSFCSKRDSIVDDSPQRLVFHSLRTPLGCQFFLWDDGFLIFMDKEKTSIDTQNFDSWRVSVQNETPLLKIHLSTVGFSLTDRSSSLVTDTFVWDADSLCFSWVPDFL